MTYEQFWNSNLSAYYLYMKSYEKERERKIEDMDILSWNIGMYMISALHCKPISAILPMSLSDMKKYATQYPNSPLSLKKESNIKKESKRKINTTPPTDSEIFEYRQFLSQYNKNKRR